MAGIIVSGGTFSGSGDMTTDYIFVYSGSYIAGEGTTSVMNRGTHPSAGGDTAFTTRSDLGPGEAGGIFDPNGGTMSFNSGLSDNEVQQNIRGVSNALPLYFYNLTILNGGDTYRKMFKDIDVIITNDVTIDDDATLNAESADTAITVSGNVFVTSGTLDMNNANPATCSFGSLTISANGTYDATTGTTVITNEIAYWPIDNLGGTFTHNDGTVEITTNTNTIIKGMDGTDATNTLYNLVCNIGDDTYRLLLRPSGSTNTIAGNLTIVEGMFQPETNTQSLTVSGNVIVSGGHLNGYSAARTGADNYGSLTIDAGASGTATTGVTTITSENGSFALDSDGTFTHNDGTVNISTPGGTTVDLNGDTFYNLIISGSETITMSSLTIDNDLTLEEDFKTAGAGQTLTVSGNVDINDGVLMNRSSIATMTFGSLNIAADGGYNATAGNTDIGVAGHSAPNFTNNGTFTHNSGTVRTSRYNTETTTISGSPLVFYNLQNYAWANQKTMYLSDSFQVENEFDVQAPNAGYSRINANDVVITIGTDTSSGSIFSSQTWLGDLFIGEDNCMITAKNELYPANMGPYLRSTYFNYSAGDTLYLRWLNFVQDFPASNQGVTYTLSGACEFQVCTIPSNDTLNCSGQRVTFGGTMTTAADGLIISGALVEMTGAGNWLEGGYQQYMGRDSASVIWNSTGYYSPNGGYLNTGWENVLWNADARVNQDGVFRGTNLIVAGQLDANNRAIGTSGSPTQVVIANGGTVSSSTNTFNASSFSNRGGLFASSSALEFTNSEKVTITENFDAIAAADAFTLEAWVRDSGASPGGPAETLVVRGNNWSAGTCQLYLSSDGNIRLAIYFDDGGEEISTPVAQGNYRDGKWHNYVGTFDGTDLKIYHDGKLVLSEPRVNGPNIPNQSNGASLGVRGSGFPGLIGQMGRATFWDTALTAAQIRTMLFQDFDAATTTDCLAWYQFDEGESTVIGDSTSNAFDGTYDGDWANGGTWTAGNKVSSSAANLYIGNLGVEATVFGSSYFPIANRSLVEGAKFASKAHEGTYNYYIDTSGATDYLAYQQLAGAPIGSSNDVDIMPNSYFTFDTAADNEQCNTLLNETGSTVRINTDEDFYTQDFDNKGTWLRNTTYGGTIHDDGSTPHEYNPIDIMDDQDSGFDTEDLID